VPNPCLAPQLRHFFALGSLHWGKEVLIPKCSIKLDCELGLEVVFGVLFCVELFSVMFCFVYVRKDNFFLNFLIIGAFDLKKFIIILVFNKNIQHQYDNAIL
jgi:hypothetical protein